MKCTFCSYTPTTCFFNGDENINFRAIVLEFKRKPAGRQTVVFSSFLRREKRNSVWRSSKQALREAGQEATLLGGVLGRVCPGLGQYWGVRSRGIKGGRGRGNGKRRRGRKN